MSFDQKCFDLATHFMSHASVVPKAELAGMIQRVVEDYVSEYEERLERERYQVALRDAETKSTPSP
jgi:hypothetical protein